MNSTLAGEALAIVGALDRSSLTDRAHTLLKDQILAQVLKPGHKIDIDRLAREWGISRSPLKDALHRLASDGLVTVVSRRGTFVAGFDLDGLFEALDVRMALEMHASRRGAARATTEQVQKMQTLLENMERDFPSDEQVHANYPEFLAQDRRFHLLLVATASNRKLLELCENLQVHIQVARAYYKRTNLEMDRVHTEHLSILEAFKKRDGDSAARFIENHLERTKRSLFAERASEQQPGRLATLT